MDYITDEYRERQEELRAELELTKAIELFESEPIEDYKAAMQLFLKEHKLRDKFDLWVLRLMKDNGHFD